MLELTTVSNHCILVLTKHLTLLCKYLALELSHLFLEIEASWPTVHLIVETPNTFLISLGTHINFIKRPQEEPDLYYDRKQNWSLNVLAVAQKDLSVIYYHIGAFGSAHDKRVYRCSALPEKLAQLPAGLLILGLCL